MLCSTSFSEEPHRCRCVFYVSHSQMECESRLKYYCYYWTRNDCSNFQQYSFNDISISSTRFHLLYETKGISQSTYINSTSQMKYTLRNLQIQQQYHISIRAETQYNCFSSVTSTRLYGEYSNKVNVMTGYITLV